MEKTKPVEEKKYCFLTLVVVQRLQKVLEFIV